MEMSIRSVILLVCLLMWPPAAHAQRELHWSNIDVEATLNEAGVLQITEIQTMVFTGDWNGGERRFDIRPRQRLSFFEISRAVGGGWQPLSRDSDIDDVDEYAFVDAETLRWRSRGPGDPPFAHAVIRYLLHYELANILLRDDDDYVLDHDFLFDDRDGDVERFTLRLTLDPAWQAKTELRDVYRAERVRPGNSFVLTVPLRYTGAGTPLIWDTRRSPRLEQTVIALLSASALLFVWFFWRENANGRFAPVTARVDEGWVRQHVLAHPPEVVGAAWDEDIGESEVVALIARMESERKLKSRVQKGTTALSLDLTCDREKLQGHERTLVNRLFFDGRSTTNTNSVKRHYKDKGFNPAKEIEPELQAEVEKVMPAGRGPWRLRGVGVAVFLVSCALLYIERLAGNLTEPRMLVIIGCAMLLIGVAWMFGFAFQDNVLAGRRRAVVAWMPALSVAFAVSAFLWYYVGGVYAEMSDRFVIALAGLAFTAVLTTFNVMTSRRNRDALAFRKSLAAGREYFTAQLARDNPALRDEWYPWLLAFGLGPQVDNWSARHESRRRSSHASSGSFSSGSISTSSSSGPATWSGFAGGRAGGGGGGASWTAAVGGMAAGVSPPSSSGSSGGGGSSSGGSSGGGSSGGGGGGGW